MSLRDQLAERDRAVGSQGDASRRMLLTGATIVTMGPPGVVRGDLLLRSSTIEAIGPGLADQVGQDAIVIDASGTIIVPGLIDSHLHAWEGQLRGVAPDADFGEYMSITHGGLALHYRPEDIAIAELLSAAQAINAGTTTFIDNSHNSRSRGHSDAAIEALLSTGIRAVYAAGSAQVGDHEGQLPADLLRLREEYFSSGQDLVTLRMFNVMPSVEQWRFADEHGFDLCAEMGFWVPDVEKLGESGLMRPGHTYNHCSGFSDAMWGAIADSGAAVNLVPRSDSQYGLGGFSPVLQADRHGIQIGISSDNELSYAHDMFAEMRTLLTVQRGLSFAAEYGGEADVPPRYGVEDVLRAATVGGALNTGRQAEIGTIEVGKKADLVVIALDQVTTRMFGSDIGAVVNCGSPAVVDTVIIDGKIRKWGGELVGVDYDALARSGEASRSHLLERYGVTEDDIRAGLRVAAES
ncbi:Cytosine/adenosine deaminase [Microbacterium sp. cf046]|uniref:amidohydrolase family protein n=1 Tax=Microbacterium sp. cf046 TaxID=1761803 RepID=UPI0008E5F433|nr:amidohydrolase family protein [Microbacterium sp. cf046]SFS15544.1 Cytosine/adenosine deaminase [Microbacterium sp. cf046]